MGSLLLALAGPAMARAPVDLDAIDADMVGSRTRVLVLGTFHLSEHADEFEPQALEPLLQRLEAFAPEVITVESISGEQCDLVMRYRGVYSEGWDRFCFDTGPARAATGLDVPAANVRMHELLRELPGSPAPSQRRELASVFLAAGEPDSALVQWLQLDEGERRAGDGLDAALVETLDKRMRRRGETALIAARLAALLGEADRDRREQNGGRIVADKLGQRRGIFCHHQHALALGGQTDGRCDCGLGLTGARRC